MQQPRSLRLAIAKSDVSDKLLFGAATTAWYMPLWSKDRLNRTLRSPAPFLFSAGATFVSAATARID